ncbi:divergent polysaccharide deacetylase family protein [Rhizobiaceae bacterium n13]|uniref:Divergent polysaccharide deacetylase family protein n=1 Tax=Ferirhizobium litorale TaxID=2927786 RepID=A0AAE3U280_9HYPH|nr:divergent polysaccharide deacetylase family protein [Fererhizobium litorale]MDI7863092.1 divergent polysaccharide deacetylase family protein [Fererhizobium litorale]MDI7923231.1 divergent polysaccharide deacetylase family protein [Fererhizobium litorale]
MGTDLHTPLGQQRAGPKKKRRIRIAAFASACCVLAIGALSVYGMLLPENIGGPVSDDAESAPEVAGATQATAKDAAATEAVNGMPRVGGRSGANVERTVTDDGSVVTKFSPRPRDGNGPALVDATTMGQDPRMATLPNEDLLEDSPYGRLPITGPDGLRPVDQYARPWSGARGTRIAIVVSGLGLSQTGTQRAIKELPEEVTLAFAASGNSLQRWMQEARRTGHEILIQVPFEPFDYPENDPGPGALLVENSPDKNLAKLHEAMGKITNYTGIMNYLGGRFLSNADALEPVMRDVAGRGLLFLDDGSSAQSLTGTLAKALEAPQAFADVQLDGQLDQGAILKKLDELERIARRNGSAIGVAAAFDESIAAIRKWSEEASLRGIEIVGVSALAKN